MVGRAGIVLNHFNSHNTMDFTGFPISDDTINLLPKYFNTIQDFSTPSQQQTLEAGLV